MNRKEYIVSLTYSDRDYEKLGMSPCEESMVLEKDEITSFIEDYDHEITSNVDEIIKDGFYEYEDNYMKIFVLVKEIK